MATNKIKKPLISGVAKTPVIIQMEALECGAACLAMILAYYNKWIPLEKVRIDCGVSRDGSNAKNILVAARYYGLTAKGFRMEPESLKKEGLFPCIIHWSFNHFIVVNGFKGDKVYINDPARGEIIISSEEFDENFTGIALMFEPGPNFKPAGRKKDLLSYAFKRLKGAKAALVFTFLSGTITALMGVISPAFSRVFIDRLLSGSNPEWATPFLLFLSGFVIIQLLVAGVNAIYSRRLGGKMAAVGNLEYMWKVLHLPMNFFAQRMAGDIKGRQSTNATIAATLVDTFAPLILNAFMMIFYLIVMFRYSALLSLIGLSSIIINSLVSNLISKKRVNLTRVQLRDQAKLASSTISGIEMIETIKASGAEEGYFAKWAGHQAAVNYQMVRFARNEYCLGMIPGLLSMITDFAVLFIGACLSIQGEFTIGMIMAFQGFLSSFMAPALTLVSAGQTLQEIRTDMERVDDVMEYQEDEIFSKNEEIDEKAQKLSGAIELKDIVFGYSPLGKPLIQNFNASIKPGTTLAIVGGSGCGKSTISKLISGLYKPWSGEILFDGKPLSATNSSIFHGSLAVVDQEIILFEDTIANNIKMWDNSIEDFEMIIAARDAQIHDDIMARPDGYNHKLIEGGRDFSGGQRQRLEIARVLAQDPTIIILDEATSALDAKTEYDVVRSIRDRGITCIVIAHRLSTIRSCDEIIVMDKGEIVDRGNHKYLLNNCEAYRNLVTSD